MERQGLPNYFTETQAEKDLRAQDIREFWKGYQLFKSEHPDMVTEVAENIVKTLDKFGIEKDKYDRRVAEETLMVFIYAAQLARDLRPSLTKNVPVPRVLITEDGSQFTFQRRVEHEGSWKHIKDSWFEARLSYLFFPETTISGYLEPWFTDVSSTVSEFLVDRVIVEIAAAGAEEYGHELYPRKKSVSYLRKAKKGNREAIEKAAEAKKKGNSEEANILYHTSDIERRGVIWTHNLLEKHFPHWTAPIRDIDEKVRDFRLNKLAESKRSFWQKLLG